MSDGLHVMAAPPLAVPPGGQGTLRFPALVDEDAEGDQLLALRIRSAPAIGDARDEGEVREVTLRVATRAENEMPGPAPVLLVGIVAAAAAFTRRRR